MTLLYRSLQPATWHAPGGHQRYDLTLQLGSARKWIREGAFLQQVEPIFAFWCSKLDLGQDTAGAGLPSAKDHAECWQRSIAAEEALARQVEDPAPIATLQRDMLTCLRKFFDRNARRGWYPHHPPERVVWQYIRSPRRPAVLGAGRI